MDSPDYPLRSPPGLDSPGPRRLSKIADIEVLRGVSILLVLASHLSGTLIPWGIPVWDHIIANYFHFWSGVDLFFAISGFVIGRSLLPKLRHTADLHAYAAQCILFWVRRVWRLLPSAWFWLAVILVAAAFFNRSGSFGLFHDNFESTVAALLGVANLRFGYVFLRWGYGDSAPYWSLALEEQFYLMLPFVAFFAGRLLVPVLLAALAVLVVMPDVQYTGVFRFQPILLGVLLAEFSRSGIYHMVEPRFLAGNRLAASCLLVLPLALMAALTPMGQRIVPAFRFDFIAALSAVLVLIASYDRSYTWPDGWLKSLMMWFGSRSYSIYLTHAPAFAATHELFLRLSPKGTVFGGHDTLRFMVTGLALAIGLAELSFRLLEWPLRQKGVRITRAMAIRFAAAPAG